jgi:hypothetical protein
MRISCHIGIFLSTILQSIKISERWQPYRSLILQFGYTGQKFPGYCPAKPVNQDSAEIDDISVIRDGDHLFLMET